MVMPGVGAGANDAPLAGPETGALSWKDDGAMDGCRGAVGGYWPDDGLFGGKIGLEPPEKVGGGTG